MKNNLHDPLGLEPPDSQTSTASGPWGSIALGGLGFLVVGLVAFSVITDDGTGGRPIAQALIEPLAPAPASVPAQQAASVRPATQAPANAQALPAPIEVPSMMALDVRTGGPAQTSQVSRSTTPAGALVIQVPQPPVHLQLTPAPDQRLVEKGKHGPLPKMAADGSRPSDIYARPVVSSPSLRVNAPRIAIVVGSMGLNAVGTRSAIAQLPGEVTLGFAPYGGELATLAQAARENGHEILLQVPMEPYEKADIPGPYTLMAGAEAGANLDGLHWFMSRITGYVGIANFLGAKFAAREADLAPVMRELTKRGLLYLDDSTAAQSRAMQVAGAAGVGFGKVDVVLDLTPTPEAVQAALGRLEAIARSKGSAIGFAQGLPLAIDPIARFAQGLEKRGLMLVPYSALARSGVAAANLSP